MCGPAKRVWRLDPTKIKRTNNMSPTEAYDAAVVNAARVYGKKFHNIIFDNCHCHVALVLNELEYDGRKNWNQIRVFKSIWFEGRWVSWSQCVHVWLPFAIFVAFLVSVSCIAVFAT